MNKRKIALITLLLVFAMILPVFVACGEVEEITTNDTESTEATELPSESESTKVGSESESASASETEGKTDETSEEEEETETEITVMAPPLEDEDSDLIVFSNKLANGVNALYGSGERKNLLITNQNMTLEYNMDMFDNKLVSSIKNTKGKSYIENTMDVFVKMKNNDTLYYASSCNLPTVMNTYRYGLYYYQIMLFGQNFTNTVNVEKELDLGLKIPDVQREIEKCVFEDGVLKTSVLGSHDPYMYYKASMTPFAADEYNYISITMKVDSTDTSSLISSSIYVIAGSSTSFNESQKAGFKIQTDGEWHTYYIQIDNVNDYTGNVSGLRIEMDGLVGDYYEIKDIKAIKGNTNGAPELSLNRIFNAFSDKMIHNVQVTATKDTTDIEEIGVVTNIAADTVDKLIVKDAAGHHETLDGVDWDTAEYIGFDIKNVGIFGYILVADETSGKLTVTVEDGSYVIKQSRAPEGNTLLRPDDTTVNTGDFYMGQRIYTDENHDFDAFLKEAYIERNPLPAENFTVDYANSTKGSAVHTNLLFSQAHSARLIMRNRICITA